MPTRRDSDSYMGVRQAIATDAGAVTSCVVAAFQPYIERIGKPPSPMLADYASLIAAGHVWIVELNCRIEGVLVSYETTNGFYLETVAVHPSRQGIGIGRALLLLAEQEATRRGLSSIYLNTNAKMTENQILYTKIGYIEYERKFEAGYDRVFFRKQLRRI